MITNRKQPQPIIGQYLFYRDFIQSPSWRSIRLKASFVSALFICSGILLPFFLGFFISLKQDASPYFLQYYACVTIMSIIVCLPITVFLIKIGLTVYIRITKKNLKRYGF